MLRLFIICLALSLSLTALFAFSRMDLMMETGSTFSLSCQQTSEPCHANAGDMACLNHCLTAARPVGAMAQSSFIISILSLPLMAALGYLLTASQRIPAACRVPIPRDLRHIQTIAKRE